MLAQVQQALWSLAPQGLSNWHITYKLAARSAESRRAVLTDSNSGGGGSGTPNGPMRAEQVNQSSSVLG